MISNYTHEDIVLIIEEWGIEGFKKGYTTFVSSDEGYIKNLEHIEAIGDVGLFDSDLEACYMAEEDGIELIYYNNVGYVKTAKAYDLIIHELQDNYRTFTSDPNFKRR